MAAMFPLLPLCTVGLGGSLGMPRVLGGKEGLSEPATTGDDRFTLGNPTPELLWLPGRDFNEVPLVLNGTVLMV